MIAQADARLIPLRDKAADVVITDPPYSEHVHSKSMRGLTAWQGKISEHRELGFTHLDFQTLRASARELVRISKRWILVFSDVESAHLWRAALTHAGVEYLRTGAWVKKNCTPQFTGDRPAVGFEAITICHHRDVKKRWNGGGRPAVYEHLISYDRRHDGLEPRIHPAQKPLSLMRDLVNLFSEPGETIADPFVGSGTTLRAAEQLGRRAIGFDLELKWCKESQIKTAQAGLFGGHNGQKETRTGR